MTLPEIAVKRPIATLMALISVLVLGVIALTRLELAFMPESEKKRLNVIANYPNASAKAIERMIVKPIEDSLSSINGLKHMDSRANSSGARIRLNFSLDVNMDSVRAEVHERIDRIRNELPEDLEKIIVSDKWDVNETGETILEARVSSNKDLSKNYALLERKLIKPLQRIPGVAIVRLDGVNPREVRINLDLKKIKQYNIRPQNIVNDLNMNNQNAVVGILRSSESKIFLRSLGRFTSTEEIARQPISNTHLRISDVAEVIFEEPPLKYGRNIDGNFAVGLYIAKESSAKTIEVTEAVHQKINNMKGDPELSGIQLLVWQDQGKEIKDTLMSLEETGTFGAILACIVLFFFLRNLSATIIAVFCIPFSLIVACGVIWLQGKSLNTISLLGLIVGIGMLVDNAVVIMENIDRYQKKGYSGRVAAILGSKEVSVAVITATITSLIVFTPMIFTKPTETNVILQELGITISITLLASLFISQTLIPLASAKLLRDKAKKSEGKMMLLLQKHYERILNFTLNHRWLAVVAGFVIFVATLYPLTQMNFNFEMSSSSSFVGIRVDAPEASSLVAKKAVISQVEQALLPHKDKFNVKAIYSWWDERYSIVRLYMKTGFQNEEDMNKVRRQLPQLLPKIAGVNLQVEDNTPFWKRNSGKRIGVSLKGNDSETLDKIGRLAVEKLERVEGLFGVYSSGEGNSYELHAQLDRERMFNYSVNSNQPSNLISTTFRGRELSKFKTDDDEVNMKLMLEEKQETYVHDVKNLQIIKNDGKSIALENIAKFSVEKSQQSIKRENKITSINIGARFSSGKRADYHKQMIEVLKTIPLPNEYEWNFEGRSREAKESQQEFIISFIFAVFLIFMVIASLFESISQALALMISLPFALAGAFWTLYWFGIDFDQPASVAVLLLLGIVVNNGIVMVEHINFYRREGWERTEAMLQGGKERLRPIIMTALTTLVGLIPIVIQKPSLGGVYYYSMAYVIIGGLFFSTLLTSIFLPAIISLIEDTPEKIKWYLRKLGILNKLVVAD